jgi:hypothetical protein
MGVPNIKSFMFHLRDSSRVVPDRDPLPYVWVWELDSNLAPRDNAEGTEDWRTEQARVGGRYELGIAMPYRMRIDLLFQAMCTTGLPGWLAESSVTAFSWPRMGLKGSG